MAKEVQGKVKVKRDRIAAKLICGSVIPIALVGGIGAGIYCIYWSDQSYYAHMWKDTNNQFIWKGNVRKLSSFRFEIKISDSLKYNKLTFKNKDGSIVPITKVIELSCGSSTDLTWTLNGDGTIETTTPEQMFQKGSSSTETTCIVEVKLNYNGYVEAMLEKFEA